METEKTTTSTETEAKPEQPVNTPVNTIVDAIFDVGEAWAAYGLRVSKLALLTSARTLKHAARAIESVQTALETKAAEKPASGDVIDTHAA